jgi:hypothetical protein
MRIYVAIKSAGKPWQDFTLFYFLGIPYFAWIQQHSEEGYRA